MGLRSIVNDGVPPALMRVRDLFPDATEQELTDYWESAMIQYQRENAKLAHNCSFVGLGKPRRLLSHSGPPRCQSTGTPAQPARACSRPLLTVSELANLDPFQLEMVKQKAKGGSMGTTLVTTKAYSSVWDLVNQC